MDVFRLGRLNLFYLTLDQEHCGFYNEAERTWQPLDESFLRPLKSAVAMAAKRQPVEMVSLPLGRMVQAMKTLVQMLIVFVAGMLTVAPLIGRGYARLAASG